MVSRIAHITGSIKVKSSSFFQTYGYSRQRRTVSQMLFQPYESSQEFIFCARRTFIGALGFTFFILDPVLMASVYAILLGISLMGSLFKLDFGQSLRESLFQEFIDNLTAPIALVLMCTRGFSTLLQATGVYDYDAASCSSAP